MSGGHRLRLRFNPPPPPTGTLSESDVKLGSLTLIRHKMTLSHFSKGLIRPVSGGQRWMRGEMGKVKGERGKVKGERRKEKDFVICNLYSVTCTL